MNGNLMVFTQAEIDQLLQAKLVEEVDPGIYRWNERGRLFMQSVMGLLTGSGLQPLTSLPVDPPAGGDQGEDA